MKGDWLAERVKRCFYFMSKGVINYAFKSYVINNFSEILEAQKLGHIKSYALYRYQEDGLYTKVLSLDKYNVDNEDLRRQCKEANLLSVYNECVKINNASYARTKRLRCRVADMLSKGDCIFVTMTFTDDVLNSTDTKQRRVIVSRYLKTFKCVYIANIDFGAKNHREHYHAIIQSSSIDLSLWRKFGNINVERIKCLNACETKLAKYISKLSNHAIKETTKRSSLIYSR